MKMTSVSGGAALKRLPLSFLGIAAAVGLFIVVAAGVGLCWNVDEDIPNPSTGDIIFHADIVRFYGGPGRNAEEIYCVVPNEQIQFVEKNGAFIGNLKYTVEVMDGDGRVLETTEKTVVVGAPSADDAVQRMSVQVLQSKIDVAPGAYRIKVTLKDLNAKKKTLLSYILKSLKTGETEVLVDSRPFNAGQVQISDIEFARSIRHTSEGSFQKSGYEIVPNAQRRYGSLLPEMPVYFEIYDLREQPVPDSVLATYSIVTREGNTIFSNQVPVDLRGVRFGATAVFDVTSLNGGSYVLDVSLNDYEGNLVAESRRKFDVAWSRLSWGKYEVERVEDMAFVLTEEEMKEFQSLSTGEQERFMIDFWKKIDPTPATVQNEAMIEHYRRVAYADEHYGTAGVRGALTDRGKIYIKYGAPDDIQSFFSDYEFIRDKRDMEGGDNPVPTDPFARVGIKAGTDVAGGTNTGDDEYADQRGGTTVHGKPYETWSYDGPGNPVRRLSNRIASSAGMRFMFVDERGIGDYRLIYSSESQEY
jgi:GWxTD domain-containing protein